MKGEPREGRAGVLLALPAGLLFGRGLAMFIMASFSTETVRMPIEINPSTYSLAVTVVLALVKYWPVNPVPEGVAEG